MIVKTCPKRLDNFSRIAYVLFILARLFLQPQIRKGERLGSLNPSHWYSDVRYDVEWGVWSFLKAQEEELNELVKQVVDVAASKNLKLKKTPLVSKWDYDAADAMDVGAELQKLEDTYCGGEAQKQLKWILVFLLQYYEPLSTFPDLRTLEPVI